MSGHDDRRLAGLFLALLRPEVDTTSGRVNALGLLIVGLGFLGSVAHLGVVEAIYAARTAVSGSTPEAHVSTALVIELAAAFCVALVTCVAILAIQDDQGRPAP